MKTFKTLRNQKVGAGLTIFDIDDTLFKSDTYVIVKKDGKVVARLNPMQYNLYVPKKDEQLDFSQFKDAQHFYNTAKPIDRMMRKASAILRNIKQLPNSRMILVTARADFDDRDTFLQTFRKYGFDIDSVHVERAGNFPGPTHITKPKSITKYLDTGKFTRARMFDDHQKNLDTFLDLAKQYPDIKFDAYLVNPQKGTAGRYHGT